jgi:hypothetical protein
MATTPSEYGIHRHNDRAAWLAYMRRNRTVHQKRFTDAVYGGKDQALKEAKAWRDAIVAECPSLDKRERREILRSINTSGVAGVHKWTVKGKTYWRALTKVGPG